MFKRYLVFFCLLLITTSLFFSIETGEIVGKVVDEEGSPLPGVTITIKGPSLLKERVTYSLKDGTFRFPLLPTGTYTLTYELPGFVTVIQKKVVVRLGMTTHVSVKMKIAKVEEKITVTAIPPLIDKASTDTSYRLSSEDLEIVPTQARSVADVVKFTPGVTGVRASTRRGTPENGLPVFRGEGEEGNNWLIDGLSVRGVRLNNPGMRLNFDAIEEIQIISDPFTPDFGSTFGGIVNVVTKSGGNEFHGETAIIFRDKNLQAKREDQLSISTEPEYFSHYNWYFNLGGPIIKDKIWFFISNNYSKR
ncbi:carboxypeptidase regulatory-like domain-containing protein [Candidatus Aminicenantes bacterium AC-335-L06]|nr:carboxypeptidase regulatory-like domain-containing protein [Candidatus Aminicenantes bacterium AC-335-L06]